MKTIIAMLIVFGLALLSVAFYRNWVVLDTYTDATGNNERTTVNITFDRHRTAEDIDKARARVEEITRVASAETPADPEITRGLAGAPLRLVLLGEIKAVDAQKREVILQVEGASEKVRVTDQTRIRRHDRDVTLTSLKPGENALVTVRKEEGNLIALTVTLVPAG